jgi:hypothetical protein
MLAQEQAVIRRAPGIRKGVEGAFGRGGETEGTLILTDSRLVYVHGGEVEEDVEIGTLSKKQLFFADVDVLDSMDLDKDSVEIPIARITKVAGHGGEPIAPKLEVRWTDSKGSAQATEFVQQVTGGSRKKNLNDWSMVIEKLKTGSLKVRSLPPAPGEDSLEGKILTILGDMQEKGPLEIEEQVEERYELDLDPDEVEAACDKLTSTGLVTKVSPKGEDPYFRKISPLGPDDLGA